VNRRKLTWSGPRSPRSWMESRNCTGPDRQPSRIQLYFDFGFASRPDQDFFPITEHEYLIARKAKQSHFQQTHHQFFRKLLQLILTDGSIYPQKGKILLADRQVDPGTGTIRIVAAFLIPETFCVPASTDVCASRPAQKRRFAATAKRRSESAGKLSGGSCRSDHK